MQHKKYGLLESGKILPLYFSNGEPRWIQKEGNNYYLIYDEYMTLFGSITQALIKEKIIKEADNKKELENGKNNR